jgi:ribosomal protein S18 acetylase RimI-like enzyme
VAGLCISAEFFGHDFLALLFVASGHRRRRIATALVRAWEARAGSPKLFTSTNQSNVPMQRLCDGLGYVRSGLIENLDEGDPEVVYFKPNPTSSLT